MNNFIACFSNMSGQSEFLISYDRILLLLLHTIANSKYSSYICLDDQFTQITRLQNTLIKCWSLGKYDDEWICIIQNSFILRVTTVICCVSFLLKNALFIENLLPEIFLEHEKSSRFFLCKKYVKYKKGLSISSSMASLIE